MRSAPQEKSTAETAKLPGNRWYLKDMSLFTFHMSVCILSISLYVFIAISTVGFLSYLQIPPQSSGDLHRHTKTYLSIIQHELSTGQIR